MNVDNTGLNNLLITKISLIKNHLYTAGYKKMFNEEIVKEMGDTKIIKTLYVSKV